MFLVVSLITLCGALFGMWMGLLEGMALAFILLLCLVFMIVAIASMSDADDFKTSD